VDHVVAGAVRQVVAFMRGIGSAGIGMPDSAAWSLLSLRPRPRRLDDCGIGDAEACGLPRTIGSVSGFTRASRAEMRGASFRIVDLMDDLRQVRVLLPSRSAEPGFSRPPGPFSAAIFKDSFLHDRRGGGGTAWPVMNDDSSETR